MSDSTYAALEELLASPLARGSFGKIQGLADQVIAET